MGRLDGKVAFITGVARGQGRSHATRLAAEGAWIVGVDICADIPSNGYPMATGDELDETVALVEATCAKMVGSIADIRDFHPIDQTTMQLGPLQRRGPSRSTKKVRARCRTW